jgi:hypothetical protein
MNKKKKKKKPQEKVRERERGREGEEKKCMTNCYSHSLLNETMSGIRKGT